MRYVLLSLLSVLAAAVLCVVALLWHRWTFRLHIRRQRVLLEVRLGGRWRRLYQRELSEKNQEIKPSRQTKKEKPKKADQKSWTDRFAEDKKRIYDEEHGGFQTEGMIEVFKEYRDLWHTWRDMIGGFIRATRHRIEISSLWIRLDFGTGDPAHTGMVYAWIHSGIGMIYPMLCRYFRMCYPKSEITPDFYQTRFDFEWKSIIKVRPAQILHAAIKQCVALAVTYCYKHFTKGSVKHG